ncbi:arginine--tRNA ligase [Candidatus Kaiserbacteria bacterium CG10_big_fil_rev_8_21_14_0_10_49_17]|uniref:Arginine--tRNA ligase n=1 Tax=Candidatus Kaiserbacteria bacterium CG10_big_fil_rev_8_21_14_0_10_49_17 TaxID=1974609 RepID=A0A2M6WDP8_9BACT|nr:MAG: arginine--tRNA ligase [Candidatus Kaiserbacteria bacterium CG10_big_fil_rev_8_21_14_0_10_49_17]
MIQETLRKLIADAAGVSADEVPLEHPVDIAHGDYASPIALSLAQKEKEAPRAVAERIAARIEKNENIEAVTVAGAGYINVTLSKTFLHTEIQHALQEQDSYGKGKSGEGRKVMVEYTDPNPFKEFHIGHLMSNTIGESIARIIQWSGAEVKRANYQGDVGLHVAQAIWGLKHMGVEPTDTKILGTAYALGAQRYKEDSTAKNEIDAINRAVYSGEDETVQELYRKGRAVSLAHFEEIYKILGTKFDFYFFESESTPIGKEMVKSHLDVFEESDGAVIYRGEQDGLHTRVFITARGIPTYETKDLGLTQLKEKKWDFDTSITITASEQAEYFKVMRAALRRVAPESAEKIEHITHGMMRLPSGKMSSRTGDVIAAEAFLEEVKDTVLTRMGDKDETIAEQIALSAVKYIILRQATGKDIVYDKEQATRFEGDTGPYLQYTYARIQALLSNAGGATVEVMDTAEKTDIERLLYRFAGVAKRAAKEREPHHLATYLAEVASAFNSWYGKGKILDGTLGQAHKLALASATAVVLKNGLWLLGIEAPERM